MGDTNRKRVLLVSGAVILLCMTIIVGMTFALFTDSKRVENHLKAGNLSVNLKRTFLEYRVLDNEGRLYTTTVNDTVDFTSSTTEKVFGVASQNARIAPGSYFKAEMYVENVGDVAFNYNVSIMLDGQSNALAEQLQVTVTFGNGEPITKKLSELANGLTITSGELVRGSSSQSFTVEVYFVDDTSINNAAQLKMAGFDLLVTATQSTK